MRGAAGQGSQTCRPTGPCATCWMTLPGGLPEKQSMNSSRRVLISYLLMKLALFSNFLTMMLNRILTCFIHKVCMGVLKHNLLIGVATGRQPKHMLKPVRSRHPAQAQASQHLVNGRTRAVRSSSHQRSYEERHEHHQVPDCGKEVQSDEKFCHGCGTTLEWRYR